MSPAKKRTVRKASAKEVATPEKTDIEAPPPAIPAKDIKETITTEVVVVGAGVAGLTAAISAAEAGARTILIEKGPTPYARGLETGAINSRLQKKMGVEIDRDKVISTIMDFGVYRNDQSVVTLWADNCGRVMDWLLDMAEAANVEVILDTNTRPWYFAIFESGHIFMPGWQETLGEILQNKARDMGVDFRFNAPVVRLLRKGKGKVTGVIAQNSKGEYIQFNASKGVVLCTGDYGNNRQMVQKYCEWSVLNGLKVVYEPALNTGDGHRMGMWIGAAMDNPPHSVALWDFASFSEMQPFILARQPWLYVTVNGERFMNEDIPYGYECNQILLQPGGVAWSIWDAKWPEEAPKMKGHCCKSMGPPANMWDPKHLDEALENGGVLTAQTIEELAQKMKVPVDKFKSTVARYNELARKGKDLDFGKHPERLTTLEKAPFFACKMEIRLLVTLGGLKVNNRLQVMDTNSSAIPGLYAAGNVSGSFFGSVYPVTIPGLTHSRAVTFGRLAGLNAAAEKV
jgi:fumarate reductase flavoprotein subunit